MKTNLDRIAAARARAGCTVPVLGEMLGHYVLNLLEDAAAEEVEDHFIYCRHCREKYLNALSIVDAVPEAKATRRHATAPAVANGARVIRIADYKRDRH